MPWTSGEFRMKWKNGTPEQCRKAAKMANAMLREGADEGVAIATAIKRVKMMGMAAK